MTGVPEGQAAWGYFAHDGGWVKATYGRFPNGLGWTSEDGRRLAGSPDQDRELRLP